MRPGERAIALLLAASLAGCYSSEYTPPRDGRVRLVVRNGVRGYERDGEFHRTGMFEGGLIDSVRGNPRAEHYARRARRHTAISLALLVAAVPCVIGAAYLLLAADDTPTERWGFATLGGCVLLETGAIVSASAVQPAITDAINVYNDDLTPQLPPGVSLARPAAVTP